MVRRFSPLFDASAHTDLYQAQIRIVARPSATQAEVRHNAFLRRKDTEEWTGDVAKTVVALNRTGGPFAH